MVTSLTIDSKPRPLGGTAAADPDPRDSAGLLLGRLTALPALVFAAFMLAGFPLLLFGYFRPIPVLVLWAALAVLVVPYVWRRVPSVTGAAAWGTSGQGGAQPTPRWALWSLVAVSVAFGVFNAAFHSQFIIVEYDAASYMQFASWISQHGTTLIAENARAFGGQPASITYASAAFFQVDGHVVPQFMAGLPMVLSLGFWAGGTRLALFGAPVLGALAVFTFGGLAARLVGPRWSAFAALALGVTVPMQYVSRNTWSEPLALVFLVGGLSLWIDSQRTGTGEADSGRWRTSWRHHSRSASHVLAAAAGLLLGLVFLVRVDGPADILFVIPYCGLLVLRRQRQVVSFMAGLIAGTLYGAVDGVVLSLPYLRINGVLVIGEWGIVILVLLAVAAAVWWLRRRGSELRNPPKPWLVRAVVILPFAVLALSAVRPYLERGWHTDYLHDYAPLSLHWVYWYAGVAAIVLAVIAYAVLGRRCVKGEAPVWVLPVMVFACATCIFLVRPAITPHQPMASRRLVSAVLPGVILLAVWMAAWLGRKSRAVYLLDVPAYLKHAPRMAVIAVCAAAIALPPMLGNLTGLAFKRTFVGEVAAVSQVCAGIPQGRSVLIIDAQLMLKFGQAIRGTCGVPVAAAHTTLPGGYKPDTGNTIEPATIIAAVRAIQDSGHQPLVLAATPAEFAPLIQRFGDGSVKLILDQGINDDEHSFFGVPKFTVAETFSVYRWEPGK